MYVYWHKAAKMCINDTDTQRTHVLGLEGHETLTRALMENKQNDRVNN